MSTPGASQTPEAPIESDSAVFPDCWSAYGATDAELQSAGTVWALAARRTALLVVAQVALALGLALSALAPVAEAVRWLTGAGSLAVLASAVVGVLHLLATPRRASARHDHLRLEFATGAAFELPWSAIAEINLADLPGRRAVGLRLRSVAMTRWPAWLAAVMRRCNSGFDYLLVPTALDPELLGRIVLRYCIDPRARRRIRSAAPTT